MRELTYNELEDVSGGWVQMFIACASLLLSAAGLWWSVTHTSSAPGVPTSLPNPSGMSQDEIWAFTTALDNSGAPDSIYYQWMQMTGQISFY